MELPPGSTIEATDRASQQLTALLLQDPSVATVQTEEKIQKATIFVKLKPLDVRSVSQQAFEKQFRAQFFKVPGVRLSFDSGGFNGGKELSIVLKSEDGTVLTRTAQALEKQMSQVPGLVEVSSTASLLKPEILIKPDFARAADQGVDVAMIARTAILATLGDNDSSLAKFNLIDRQIPIRVQLDPSYRNDIETIRNLQIQTKGGKLVPLQSVADVSFGSGPSQIDRLNRARQVSIGANLQGVALGYMRCLPFRNCRLL
jgi:multidrug efflux pump subunit AcrB